MAAISSTSVVSDDEAVQATNDDATQSKKSLVSLICYIIMTHT